MNELKKDLARLVKRWNKTDKAIHCITVEQYVQRDCAQQLAKVMARYFAKSTSCPKSAKIRNL